MAAIIDQLQRIAQIARRCPEPTLVLAYRDAARKFCLESRWLRRETTVTTIDGDYLYDIVDSGNYDPDLEIINIRVVTIEDPNGSRRRINPSDPVTWNPQQGAPSPETWAYIPEAQIAFWPTPGDGYIATLTLQVQPRDDSDNVPDDLLRKWDRAIADGTLAYLMGVPGQPWSNPQGAVMYARNFQAAINNAKADEQRGYNTGTVMSRIRKMF